MDKATLIRQLQLEPLEGEHGYFRRTYASPHTTTITKDGQKLAQRPLMSSIFYLLTSESPVCFLHKNCSDIMRYFHLGSPIDVITLHPDGTLQQATLGPDILKGELLQHLVPGGVWLALVLRCRENKGDKREFDYGLISEAVVPGFEYSDRTMATDEMIRTKFPSHFEHVKSYISR